MKIEKKIIPDGAAIFKPSAPFEATVLENRRLTPEHSEDDVRHLVLDLNGSDISYLEGQSIGVVAPGLQENGKKQKVRLYSIASASKGDDGKESTVTLTVKRVLFQDPDTGEEVKGLCSNYLCDTKVGDKVNVTGPTGRTFFLPEDDTTDIIMIAVGTGIAPFRAFIHHIYRERKSWNGKVKLFFGAKTREEVLYMNNISNDISTFFTSETLEAYQALSREEKTEDGRKSYVQNKVEENADEIWAMLNKGNFSLYICGLKGMEEGVENVFRQLAEKEGKEWEEMKESFKKEGRWNIEVY